MSFKPVSGQNPHSTGVDLREYAAQNNLTVRPKSQKEMERLVNEKLDFLETTMEHLSAVQAEKQARMRSLEEKEKRIDVLDQEIASLKKLKEDKHQVVVNLSQRETAARQEAARHAQLEQAAREDILKLQAQQDQAKKNIAAEQNNIAERQKTISAETQKLETCRQGALSIGLAKVLGMKDLEFTKKMIFPEASKPEDRPFDFDMKNKHLVIRAAGMDKLVAAATEAASKQLNWKPGDFSICGANQASVEGVTKFLVAIPEMKVSNVVFMCELSDAAISALVKASKAADGALSVKLTHAATQEKYSRANAENGSVNKKPLPAPPPGKNPVTPSATVNRPIIPVGTNLVPQIVAAGTSPPKVGGAV